MKKQFLFIIIFLFGTNISSAQIVINEFETSGMDRIELKNQGSTTVDVSTYVLCSFPLYSTISNITVVSGSTMIPPGGFLVLTGHALGDTDDELGLYLNSNFTDPNAIIDYVEWGSSGHTRSPVAQSAGIWTANDFVASPPSNVSLEYDGTGNSSLDWFIQQAPTFGLENGIVISVEERDDSEVSLFPSLVNDFIKLDLSGTSKYFSSVEVVSINGQVLMFQNIEDNKWIELNVSELKPGNYFVRVNGEQTITEKFVKE